MKTLIDQLDQMKDNRLSNYVIAGLDSYLISKGRVRYFENTRNHQDSVTPHSHRFDFTCLVLEGQVINRLWDPCNEAQGDFFQESRLQYTGFVGVHHVYPEGRGWWRFRDLRFECGDLYSMTHDQIHSIQFSKGAKVLFFEGPEKADESRILEPVVDGLVIRTYETKDYMFRKDEPKDPMYDLERREKL